MLRSPRRLVAIAIALLAVAPAILPPRAHILPADAARYEGQRVSVSGALVDARVFTDGSAVLTIAAGGAGLPVRATDPGVPRGTWLTATGVLLRSGGELRLFADAVSAGAPPEALRPSWDQVATAPWQWTDRWIVLDGTIEKGHLVAHGHRVLLGDGGWSDGPTTAAGVLTYDGWCLCHRLHGGPWTP